MNTHEQEWLKELVRDALPVITESEPARDLWPEVLRGISAPAGFRGANVPWFDWALVAGLCGFAAIFPAAIPVVLYYL